MAVVLEGLNPVLLEKVNKVLSAMQILGFPMKIVQGLRTVQQQQALYAQGRTTPGPIVTQCDGILKRSNHQSGNAVDCAFQGSDPFAESHPWQVYGMLIALVGLQWGGSWKKPDRPHCELLA